MNTTISNPSALRDYKKKLKGLQTELRTKKKVSRYKRCLTITPHTLADLQAIARSEPRVTERPRTLPLEAIKIAEKVFQWRLDGSDPMGTERNIKALTNSINGFLKGVPGEMTPILVMAIGGSFYCVDGHHRLEAYKRSRWTRRIPVHHFNGTIEQGQHKALKFNLTGKLGLTPDSRSEAAWQLVKQDTLSKSEIAALSGRSERLVATMRSRLKEDPANSGRTWADALYGFSRGGPTDHAQKEADAVRSLAKKLAKLGARYPAPNVLAKAIAALDEDLPAQIVSCWPDAARLVVKRLDDPDNLLGI